MVGRTVGNFRFVEKLGEGGVGSVYRAIDMMVEREVAIKVMKPDGGSELSTYERFRTEAVALAKLNHPSIATLYSFFREGDEYFMVMEYVKGQTLAQLLRSGGKMDWRRAVEILLPALEGVKHAHANGIVHRDLKPANIMLPDAGGVKITDFGIARAFRGKRLTQENRIVGTIEYMAPERAAGADADGRSDLFSLGVVLYQMLSGQLPFIGANDYELLNAVMRLDPKPLAEAGVAIPSTVERTMMKSLAKVPAKRQQSAAELSVQLQACLLAPEPPVEKATRIVPVAAEPAPPRVRNLNAPPPQVLPAPPVARPAPPPKPGAKPASFHLPPRAARLMGIAAGALGTLAVLTATMYYWTRPAPQVAQVQSTPVPSVAPAAAPPKPEVIPPEPVAPAPSPQPGDNTPVWPPRPKTKPSRKRTPVAPKPDTEPEPPVETAPEPSVQPIPADVPPPEPAPSTPPPEPAAKPLPAAPPPPSVRSLHEVRVLFVEPMPGNLDEDLRQELHNEFGPRLRVAAAPDSADAVLSVAVEDEHGNRVTGAAGRLVGLKGSKRAIVTLRNNSGDKLWTAEVDDRHSLVMAMRDDVKRLASRIAKRLRADLH